MSARGRTGEQTGARPTIFTIGHSTRPIEAFLRLLQAHGVDRLVDIRTIPKSRHNPQFARDALAPALRRAGIGYRHMPGLGGLRRPRPDSTNTGWRHPGFRGFADYMATPAFARSLDRLIALARTGSVAIMCAEAVPWRCHRSLVADALVVRGIDVREISSGVRATPHALTPFARVEDGQLHYPAPETEPAGAR